MIATNASELIAWLTIRLAALRGLDARAIDVAERFTRYGLDSLGAARLVADLSEHLGRPLSPTLAWEFPTVEALARHLGSDGADAEVKGRRPERGPELDPAEPIAIIGLGCRFPAAPDPASFWQLLRDGRDAVSRVPADRGWDELLAAAGIEPAERAKIERGAFLDRVDTFDPFFFGISPREAEVMDPQQRLMLELCWEALEHAGIPARALVGTRTGVFAGAIWSDYAALLHQAPPQEIGPYTVTGNHHSIIANRVSYVLGLQGPSLTLDSACSSGLVVTHLACESLRRGECELALAGAVNLDLLPTSALAVSRFGALSPDGRCYTFDARANGYVRGEGGGVVVLKTLTRAIADGDPILAVVRGSAVNNDGASNGLTAPSRAAQEAVVRAAWSSAGLTGAEAQYVEAHGTGTSLGDPIEARALGAVLGAHRPAEGALRVGSAKTNVGHLEGAAGMVGLLKLALAIEHRMLPPSLHFASPNPHAPLADLGLAVQTSLGEWPAPTRRLAGGVSSFGLGGTNGHVVLEEWPTAASEILALSAETGELLRARAEEMRARAAMASASLREMCARATEDLGRSAHGASRLAVVARSTGELDDALTAFLAGAEHTALSALDEGIDASRGPVFVFPGQGAQWFGMARTLLQREPAFRAAIEACDAHVRRFAGFSLLDQLTTTRSASRLGEIEVSLPAIIAIDIAVAGWWRSLGIEPAAVVGHSTGEIAAAHVAGALDLEDTMRTICAYGRFVGRFAGRGAMALVGLPWEAAEGALAGFEGRVFRAIEDSVASTVVAGDPEAVAALVASLQRRSVFARLVSMNVAPHSPLVDSVREELAAELAPLRPRRSRVPFFSEVTGTELDGSRLDAAHWVKNFGDPARFSGAIDALIARGHRVFLDVGPHPLTRHSIEANLRHAGVAGAALSSMRRDEDEHRSLKDALAALHVLGQPVRWSRLYPAGTDRIEPEGEPLLLPLSARSSAALAALAGSYAKVVEPRGAPAELRDIVHAASVRRDHHRCRLAVVGETRSEIAAALSAFAAGAAAPGVTRGDRAPSGPPKVVFVFPGQGSQWVGMGRALIAHEPVFRAAIEACDRAIARESGFSVLDELQADEQRSRLSEVGVVQPLLFAIQVALAALWRSWGVVPDAVVGHSMGEVAAAQVAGILSLDDAAMIICRRSRLLERLTGQGAMALVELSALDAEAAVSAHADRVSVAVSNAPRSSVIAGDPAAIDEILTSLERRGIFCRRVKVAVASHCPQVEPLRGDVIAALSDLRPMPARVPMRSTVTGEIVAGPDLGAAYWGDNLRAPVRFSGATRALISDGCAVFVELSPHPILLPAIEENLRDLRSDGAALPSARRGAHEPRTMLESLAELHVRGVDVDFRALHPSGGRHVSLPTYPWQRERFWASSSTPEQPLRERGEIAVSLASSLHPDERYWERPVSASVLPWLGDHRVRDEVVYPGAGYIEMALAAGSELRGAVTFEIADMRFERMLSLPANASRALQLVVRSESDHARIEIASRAAEETGWTRHAVAEIRAAAGAPTPEPRSDIAARCPHELQGDEHQARMERLGIAYGPRFRGVQRIWTGDREALAEVRAPEVLLDQAGAHLVHPALLDACLQVVVALAGPMASRGPLVPVGLARARLHARVPDRLWVHARSRDGGFDLLITSESGEVVAEIEALRLAALGEAPLADCAYGVTWHRRDRSGAGAGAAATWIVLGDRGGAGAALSSALRARGATCLEIEAGRLDSLRAALAEVPAPSGVVHCGGLDAATWEQTTTATLEADLQSGALSAARAAQAVLRRGFRDPPRLVLLTRGAQAVGAEPIAPLQTSIWGLGRTIALEHPELRCARVDLPAQAFAGEAEELASELSAADSEDQVALRPAGRFVQRLARVSLDEGALRPLPITADATYLIAGGLGGLGLVLAAWMVERGARHLALLGRSAPSEAAAASIRALEEAGATVRVLRADITQRADVERVFDEIGARMPPLRGLFHAAAVLRDRTLTRLEDADFWAPVRPKVMGAFHLHQATRGLPLDFFVMFSSVASLVGSPGQAAYASANAFLDGLSRARDADGLPSTSIQWGPFAEVGLAAMHVERGSRLSLQALEAFTPSEGMNLLGRVLERPRVEVGLFQVSWRRFREASPSSAGTRFVEDLADAHVAPAAATTSAVLAELAAGTPRERQARLEAHVVALLGASLRLDPARIDGSAPFAALGVDSLMSLELRNRLEKSLGLRLSAALLFTYATPTTLAAHLLDELALPSVEERATPASVTVAAEVPPAPRSTLGEPIAIVGLGCRFPGGADGPDAYFRLLEQGVDAVREIPSERWAAGAIAGDKPAARWAALLDRVDGFDPSFFGISPREAESLDPQQRLLLEVAWEALEDGGQRPDRLNGAPAGVFVGMYALDYQHRMILEGAERFDAYAATGNLMSTAAGRISFTLGLQGPCMSVDTACSSSLVAVTLACQSLRAGDCDLALAGGVSLALSPFTMAMVAGAQALSPDGRCKTLDAGANGFVRGEGCGLVVLKRLSDAERDGDRIRGVIRGWAVNQDGRSTGLTAPNVLAQQALLRRALTHAGVSAAEVGYVEMHGTGTPLGDPIEAAALREVLGAPRADGSVCWLGAAKTNIGHLEAASGVAGLIKTVLALEHEVIPANLHFERLNPRISLSGAPLSIPMKNTPWARGATARLAGVSSFGISGTNAHVIVGEAPASAPVENRPAAGQILPISAKSADALRACALAYGDRLARATDADLSAVAYTASVRRSHHEHRAAIVADTREEACAALAAFARDPAASAIAHGRARSTAVSPRVVLVFPGQGSQWLGMGRQLLDEEPVFRTALEACDAALRRHGGGGVIDELRADEDRSRLDEIDVLQPVLFAFQVALTALWRSWGIEPAVVVGHSMGEVAAAHVAGILDLDDAARIIGARSRLLRRIRGRGAVALVEVSLAEATERLAAYGDRLGVAASNGARSTAITGEPAALDEALAAFERDGVFARRAKIDVAAHSAQTDALRDDLLVAVAEVRPRAALVPMRSTVTSELVRGPELDASYWFQNLRAPVLFHPVVERLVSDGHTLFLEVSPHPLLVHGISESLDDGAAIPSLRRGAPPRRSMLEGLARLYAAGVPVAWEALHDPRSRSVDVPRYPWQRERYWIDSGSIARAPASSGTRPLLGAALSTSTQPDTQLWQRSLGLENLPYLADHRVQGTAVLPGAAYVEAAMAAGRERLGSGALLVEDMVFISPLVLRSGAGVIAEVALTREGDAWSFRFSSTPVAMSGAADASWTLHATATLRLDPAPQLEAESLTELRGRCAEPVPIERIDAACAAMGLEIGPSFQALREAHRDGAEVLGRVRLADDLVVSAGAYLVHPVTLDAALRVLTADTHQGEGERPRLLATIDRLRLHGAVGAAAWVHGHRRADQQSGAGEHDADVTIFDDAGRPVLSIEGISTRPLATALPGSSIEDLLFINTWVPLPDEPERPADARGGWLLLCDDGGAWRDVRASLVARGAHVVCAWRGGHGPGEERGALEVDASSPAAIDALIDRVLASETSLRGVVHMFGLEPSGRDPSTLEALEEAQVAGIYSALHVTQSVTKRASTARLWLVVRGTQRVGGETENVAFAHAPLWGLGRTIAMEHPDLRCTRVDLDPSGSEGEAEALVHALLSVDTEEEIALRVSGSFAGRLTRASAPPAQPRAVPVDSNATYLITGGLGGVGLLAARWLVGAGARSLVLMGRQGVSSGARASAVADLEAAGVTVHVAPVDVADPASLQSAIAQAEERLPPIRGIVHAAGALDDGLLEGQTAERFRSVLAGKAFGAFNLHRWSSGRSLDFFLLFSSMSALLGMPGVGNYVAANAFLDALAQHRRGAGLVASSIDWGLFSGVGMGANAVAARQITDAGVRGFTPDEAIDLMGRAAQAAWTQMGIAALDVQQAARALPHLASSPRFATLVKSAPPPTRSTPSQRDERALAEIAGAAPGDRVELVERFIRTQLAAILRLPASRIEPGEPFAHYGFDSLMGLELRNRIQSVLGIKVTMAEVLGQPRSGALAALIAPRVAARDELAPAPDPSPAETSPGSWVVVLRPNPGARMRLICFPYAGGAASVFSAWPEGLPADVEVCAIQAPGRHERLHEPPLESAEAMVEALVPALLPYLDRPFATFGHCLGAIIMFEALRVLADQHELRPAHVFASAAPAPPRYLAPSVFAQSDAEFAEALRFIGFARTGVLEDAEAARQLLPAVKADFEVASRYAYRPGPPLSAPVTTFAGLADPFAPIDAVEEWRGSTTSWFARVLFPGEHYFIVPERARLLEIIGAELVFRLGALDPHRSATTVLLGQRAAPRARLVCFPGVGQSAARFEACAAALGDEVDVCALELPGRGARSGERPLGRVDEIVEVLADSLADRPDLPTVFLGFDLGALLAFEVARVLRRRGRPLPRHLIVGAAMAPHVHYLAPVHHAPRPQLLGVLRLFGIRPEDVAVAELPFRAECAAMSTYALTDEAPLDLPMTVMLGERDPIIPPGGVRAWSIHTTADCSPRVCHASHDLLQDDLTSVMDALRAALDSVLEERPA